MSLSRADVEYLRANFASLEELCRERGEDPTSAREQIAGGLLPKPSYTLDDGTELYPRDLFALVDAAGGAEHARELFYRRYAAAAAPESTSVDEEWASYLGGGYGVCLHEVTPENIVRKEHLVKRIEALLAAPVVHDGSWCAELRASVDKLDGLERPFAEFDRERFGGPISRDRCISVPRERYASVFAALPAA